MDFKGNKFTAVIPHPVTKEEATKHDGSFMEKPPMHLVPQAALIQVAKVYGFGASKYKAHNWRKGMDHSRLASAALRHIAAYLDGEDLDEESGLRHLSHATCTLLMLIESQIKGYGKDDRHV